MLDVAFRKTLDMDFQIFLDFFRLSPNVLKDLLVLINHSPVKQSERTSSEAAAINTDYK